MRIWHWISLGVMAIVAAFAGMAAYAQIAPPEPGVQVSHEAENQRCFACHALEHMATILPGQRRRLVIPAT